MAPHTTTSAARPPLGLTLAELLVVLMILGLLAAAVLPAAQGLLHRTQGRSARDRLGASWLLSRALALSVNGPVSWSVRQAPGGTMMVIANAPPEGDKDPLRSHYLDGWTVEAVVGARRVADGHWQVLVPPHGLTDPVTLTLRRQGEALQVVLPGIIDAQASGQGTSQASATGLQGGAP